MNKYLRSFNYKRTYFPKFTFSTLNQNSLNTKQYDSLINNMTDRIKQEKDQQIKALFQNLEADNYELGNKIKTIMESDTTEDMKIIKVVNEINNVNINNSEKLLSIHQNYVFNYINKFILMIIISFEKVLKFFSPKTILSLIGIYLSYKYIKNNYIVNNVIEAKDVVKYYRENGEKLFKADMILPAFFDHKNISNLILNGKEFLLIGAKGIGKSYSIKHFCLIESQKDSIVIYKDLNKVDRINNIYEFICSSIVEFYKNENKVDFEIKLQEILEETRGRKAFFVLDNFSSNPELINTYRKIIDVLRSFNFTIILLSDDNSNTELALESNIK